MSPWNSKVTPHHSGEDRELVEQARVELAYGNDPRVAFVTGDTDTAPCANSSVDTAQTVAYVYGDKP